MPESRVETFEELTTEITSCRRCPRLVTWREQIGNNPRASFQNDTYWARPVPGFGDESARVVIIGLAPAAHGGNRTGRIFTGDRSGDFLFASMFRTGFSNQAESISIDDGLELNDCYALATVRCAPPDNKPTIEERDNCSPFFVDELGLLKNAQIYIALGAYAWDAILRFSPLRPKPKFTHGAEATLESGITLLGSFHPSQQNTFTGKLTEQMLDSIFIRAQELLNR